MGATFKVCVVNNAGIAVYSDCGAAQAHCQGHCHHAYGNMPCGGINLACHRQPGLSLIA
jgi:hypothetical protein